MAHQGSLGLKFGPSGADRLRFGFSGVISIKIWLIGGHLGKNLAHGGSSGIKFGSSGVISLRFGSSGLLALEFGSSRQEFGSWGIIGDHRGENSVHRGP